MCVCVHGILQARTLEWVAIPFSRGSSWPTQVSSIAGRFFTIWATREALYDPVYIYSFPGGASGKELVCQQETQELPVWPLGWEDPLEEERATHSSIRAWRIPWTEEPGRLQSIGLQRVGHDWSKSACTQACIYVYIYIFLSKSLGCRAET